MSAPAILWHYTCAHHRPAIELDGEVRPITGHAWFTDLDDARPWREALGLTSHLLACDRTRYRFRVVSSAHVVPYVRMRRTLPAAYRQALETAEGALPMHWYVATEPVPVVYAPGRRP